MRLLVLFSVRRFAANLRNKFVIAITPHPLYCKNRTRQTVVPPAVAAACHAVTRSFALNITDISDKNRHRKASGPVFGVRSKDIAPESYDL